MSLDSADRIALRKFGARLSALEKGLKRATRTASLAYSSQEGGSHDVYDDDGNLVVQVGQQPDGTYTVVDVNGAALAAPSAPVLEVRPGCLVVTWDGRDADGASGWPATFSHVRVYVTTDLDVDVVWTDLTHLAEFTTPLGGTVTLALPEATVYRVALVAVNTSGVLSPVSVDAEATPDPVATEGGVVVYYTADAPTGLAADAKAEWVDTDTGVRSRWTGSEWQVIALSPAALNLPGSLSVDMFLSTGGVIAGDPAGAGARMGSYGFRAYGMEGGVQKETFRVDANTGNVTVIGELGTAPPNEVGVFLFSTKFSWAGAQVQMPTMRFNTGATVVQPRIEGNTAVAAGLFLSSGRDTGERESKLDLNNNEARLYVQDAPGGSVGSYLRVQNDRLTGKVNVGGDAGAYLEVGDNLQLRTRPNYGTATLGGQVATYTSGSEVFAFMGLVNIAGTNRQGFLVRMNGATRIHSGGALEVVTQGGGAFRPVSASSFDVQSDRRSKHNLAAPSASALAAVRAAPTYEYAYKDDPDQVRRLGVMADDLPDLLTVDLAPEDDDEHFAHGMKGVSLPQQIALLWQAVQELDAELDGVTGLRAKKPTRTRRSLT